MKRVAAIRLCCMTTSATFTSLSTVAIPVTDQDRTRELLETLGFECRLDAELRPGFRWVEVAPSGGSTSIALVVSGDELPTGIDTGIRLVTTNARAAHAELLELGLSVGELLDWDAVPLMFSFCDFDGNRFYAVEAS